MTPFNQFVTVQLTPEMLSGRRNSLPEYLGRVQEEKLRITGQLLELSSSSAGTACGTAVRQWQNMCVELLGTLQRFRSGMPASVDIETFYDALEEMLHTVLVALEQHFADHLLPELIVPVTYAAQARRQLQPKLKAAERELKKNGLDPGLLEIILSPVKQFTGDADARICFGELIYYRELLSRLLTAACFEPVPAEQFNLQVHFLLIHLNFNAAEYFLYCTHRMRKWLRGFSDMQGRVNTLTWCIREVRNVPLLRDGSVSLVKGFPIKHQLAAWLEEERIFIRTLIETTQKPAVYPDEEMRAFAAIPQAALMARVYMEEGIIRSTSVRQLFSTVAGMLQLKKTDAGMEDVFRLRFFNPSLATVMTCKDWLGRMLERLNEYEDKMRGQIDK